MSTEAIDPVMDEYDCIEVLRRQPDGSWRFVGDIFNLDAPLRPPTDSSA